jgi:integrase
MDRDKPKPPTARAALAFAKSQAYQDAADAPATLRAYASDVKNFEAWCRQNNLAAVPAMPEVVGAYLAAAGEGYAMQTLRRRVAAIARASAIAGHPLDTKHPAIRETLRGIGRVHGSRGRKAAALTTSELKTLSRVLGDGLTGDRDRALLLVCFAGALRRSELVSLDAEKLIWFDDGVRLPLEKSKTDKEGKGVEVTIVYGRNEATCPVRALRLWLDKAQIKAGPVFRKVNKGGNVEPRRLSDDAVRQILLRCASAAGIKGSRLEPISPHGLRAGFVTTAYRNGVPDEEIMGHTRHRSLSTMRGYVRRAKLKTSEPAGKLGL